METPLRILGIASEEESTSELRTLPIALALGIEMPLTRLPGGLPLIRKGKVVSGVGVGGIPSREEDEDAASSLFIRARARC
jgi:uncharacterized protein GlcG (DUF336 family)